MATLIWRPCATCSAQSEWLCIIENAAPLKSARLRGFGGAACVLGEMCEGAGALARVLENEGCVPGRCIALSRRCVGALYRIVNCGPAQCCVWPVLAPAEAFVRAGAGLRGGRVCCGVLRSDHDRRAFLSECLAFGSRLSRVSIGMSCVRFTPAVCRRAPNRTACDMFRSYSAVGRDRR